MIYKRLPISWKLFATTAIVSTLTAVFVTAIVSFTIRDAVTRYFHRELDRLDLLEEALGSSYDPNSSSWPQFHQDLEQWDNFVETHVTERQWTGQNVLGFGERLLLPQLADATPSGSESDWIPAVAVLRAGSRFALLDSDQKLIVGGLIGAVIVGRRPIIGVNDDGSEKILGWIALMGDVARLQAADEGFWRTQYALAFFTILLMLCLSAPAAYLLSRQFIRPIQELIRSNRSLADGDLSTRMENDRADELGVLIGQFNQLAETLEKADQRERKWLSDTSHELKTPLSVVAAQVEALMDGVRKPDKKTIAELYKSVMRLSRLVEDLNMASTSREIGLSIDKRMQDIGAILAEAVDSSAISASESGLKIRRTIERDLVVSCDPLRIRQLFDNLLQNSCRYTSSPGVVEVSAKRVPEGIEICVEDTAPAPPEEILPRLFERFYRADTSRARLLGGSGLGLSIGREIVQAHGGAISASLSLLGGLSVRILFPLAEKNKHDE